MLKVFNLIFYILQFNELFSMCFIFIVFIFKVFIFILHFQNLNHFY